MSFSFPHLLYRNYATLQPNSHTDHTSTVQNEHLYHAFLKGAAFPQGLICDSQFLTEATLDRHIHGKERPYTFWHWARALGGCSVAQALFAQPAGARICFLSSATMNVGLYRGCPVPLHEQFRLTRLQKQLFHELDRYLPLHTMPQALHAVGLTIFWTPVSDSRPSALVLPEEAILCSYLKNTESGQKTKRKPWTSPKLTGRLWNRFLPS